MQKNPVVREPDAPAAEAAPCAAPGAEPLLRTAPVRSVLAVWDEHEALASGRFPAAAMLEKSGLPADRAGRVEARRTELSRAMRETAAEGRKSRAVPEKESAPKSFSGTCASEDVGQETQSVCNIAPLSFPGKVPSPMSSEPAGSPASPPLPSSGSGRSLPVPLLAGTALFALGLAAGRLLSGSPTPVVLAADPVRLAHAVGREPEGGDWLRDLSRAAQQLADETGAPVALGPLVALPSPLPAASDRAFERLAEILQTVPRGEPSENSSLP